MKLKNLFVKLAAAAMAIGLVGATGSLFASKASKVSATSGSENFSGGVFTAGTPAYITWSNTFWTITQKQGACTTAVNTSYKTAPRLYQGHFFQFEAPDGITFDSIAITYGTTYKGSDVTCGASTTSAGAVPASDGTKPTGAITLTDASSTLTTGGLGSAKSVYIQNSYKNAASYTQLRPTLITINYTSSIVNVDPTGCSVSLAKSASTVLGETIQATATITPSDATVKTVNWSSSDESVAVVSATGLVTTVANGSSTITATSTAVPAVHGSAVLTVSADPSSVYDKTIATSNWGGPTGGYGTGTYHWALDGVSYCSTQIGIMSSLIQGQKTNGVLFNTSAFSASIKDIIVTLNADGTMAATLSVGTSVSTTSTAVSPTVNGAVNLFTPAAGMTFFKISAPTGTLYITSIVVELVDTNVEAARSWANSTFTSGLAAECASLSVSSSNWGDLATSYAALSAAAKLAFTSDARLAAATDIQKALAKYAFIVTKYGHTDFMGLNISGSANEKAITTESTSSTIAAVVAILGLALCGVVILRRKKQIQ